MPLAVHRSPIGRRWTAKGDARSLPKEGTFSLCRKLQPFPQTRRKLVADSEVGCLPGRGGNSRQIVSCSLTRVDRVNPWRVDTFGTVQLDDALSVAAAQIGCNTDLS